jgi:Mrp family chromosome partitioning ATPase
MKRRDAMGPPTEAECYAPLAGTIKRHLARGVRTILITSSGPWEGKSTITAGLGRALASSGRLSVVLVDTDILRPTLHGFFKLESTPGLGELINEVYQSEPRREELPQLGFGDWLTLLQVQARTGRLVVAENGEAHVVTMHRGAVISIADEDATEDRRLGDVLVSRGQLTATQRETALRLQQETHEPLGQVVLRLGYVAAEALHAALHTQFNEQLQRVLSFRRPECTFTEVADGTPFGRGSRQAAVADADAIDAEIGQRTREFSRRPYLDAQVARYLRKTELENLKVITSGTKPYDLINGISRPAFKSLLDHLAGVFDVVLLDAPPVAASSPAETVGQLVDGVVMVVKADGLEISIVQGAKESLEKAGVNLLGVVLNQVDFRQALPTLHYYHAYRRR